MWIERQAAQHRADAMRLRQEADRLLAESQRKRREAAEHDASADALTAETK